MNKKHGMTDTRLYNIWIKMKSRCYNSNNEKYMYYGGKGITICNEWNNNFQAFYDWAMQNGYQDDLSIDRKNNNGNYEPSNCRWANRNMQSFNRQLKETNQYGTAGIYFTKSKKWKAIITVDKKRIYLGTFNTLDEAISKRLNAEKKYFGEYRGQGGT
jgi:hypothetical protein